MVDEEGNVVSHDELAVLTGDLLQEGDAASGSRLSGAGAADEDTHED
jgi:hypothetical protein